MKQGTRLLLLIFLIIFCCGTLIPGSHVLAEKQKRVVVLHSFHKGQKWNDDLSKGIEDVLKVDHIELNFEYMDAIRMTSDHYFSQLSDLYRQKYSGRKVDVVISTDEDALDFLLQNRKLIFPNSDLVYCGIKFFVNRFWEKDMTGVIESVDLRSNIQLAKTFNKDLNEIFVVMDNTPTSISLINNFIPVIEEFSPEISFIFSDFTSIENLIETVKDLSKESAVLLINYTNDKSGTVISMDESARRISKSSPVPVYSLWDSYMGQGIIGGKLVSGYTQGNTSAQIALRILNGENPETIKVQTSIPSQYIFDYQQLQKFKIRENQLPKNSIILNQPNTLYQQYKRLFFMVAFGGVALSAIIILLSLNIMHRRKVEKSLKKYSNQLDFLHRIDRSILNDFSLDTIGENILWPTLGIAGTDLIGIYLFNRDINPAWGFALRNETKYKPITDLVIPVNQLPKELIQVKNTVRLGLKNSSLIPVLFNHKDMSDLDSFLLIPITYQFQNLGILYLANTRSKSIDLNQETICRQIADSIAMAVQNDFYLKEIKSHEIKLRHMSLNILEAQEMERKRLSAELHDEFGQTLTAIGLNFSVLRKKLEKVQPDLISNRMEEVEHSIELLSDQVHNLSLDLRPPMLDDLGLIPTLRWFLNQYKERSGLNISFSVYEKEGTTVASHVAVTMYRVLQEALNNITKHAGATRIDVGLQITEKEITLQISDDGIGFDINEVWSREIGLRGLGLIGMRERLDLLDGFLEIQTDKNKGTTVQAVAPI